MTSRSSVRSCRTPPEHRRRSSGEQSARLPVRPPRSASVETATGPKGGDDLLGNRPEHGLVADAGGIAAADPVDGVEAIVRSDRVSRWRFFLNHSTAEVEIALSEPGREALSGARVEGSVRVGPRDLAIVRSQLSNATGAPPPLVG